MNELKKTIIDLIKRKQDGISIDHYIDICLHNENGYYRNNQPIGRIGDFITAPEISQLFGEIIGLYIYEQWHKSFQCEFNFVELGPGKGTLIADVLRINKNFTSFLKLMNLSLIEINKRLIELQKQTLKTNFIDINKIIWRENFDLIDSKPTIILANEFFDCFAIKQFFKSNSKWYEKKVNFNEKENKFTLHNTVVKNISKKNWLEKFSTQYKIGTNKLIEVSNSRNQYFNKICQLIKKNTGIGIIIDYGYSEIPNYSTLQSISLHQNKSFLDNPGKQDITSLVNFKEFADIANQYNLNIYGPITQRDFLINHGIKQRKEKILSKTSKYQKPIIEKDYQRLISIDEMGKIFKFLVISNYKTN